MGHISNNNLLKLLPLSTTRSQPQLLGHINGNDHQLITGSSGELGDRKDNFLAMATSRWNPTPEQVTTLEELYRSGTRTPTTEQIQQIASKLRKYGRIEGKNVFFWFQNHKARERLKRRRREGDVINNARCLQKNVKHASFPPTYPKQQNELAAANEDHGTREESERASEDGQDATWRNLVTWSLTQEPGKINNIDENKYNNVNGEEEETREIRTLNLFPVMENQEKADCMVIETEETGRFREKKNKKANQVCCNYYEFMSLNN